MQRGRWPLGLLLWLAACRGREATHGVVLEPGPRVVCDAPEERSTVGPMETTMLRAEAAKKAWMWGVGVVAGDFDGDSHADLFLPGFWESMLFLGRGNGRFVEASDRLPEAGMSSGAGGAAADYDGDGDLDILMTRFLASDVLLRNDDGVFVDVSASAGLSADTARTVSAAWGDLDQDGDLDLFIGGYGEIDESEDDPQHATFAPAEASYLYVNQGDGTLVDRSDALPAGIHDGYTYTAAWVDLDRDGWQDLYLVNDFGASFPNRLLWNRRGVLVPDDNAHGLDIATTGMGLGVGDINGDERDDLVVSAWDGNRLMVSGSGGRWFDWSSAAGVHNDRSRGQKIAWGNELLDMNNDGILDVFMTYGWLDSTYPAAERQPDALYLGSGDQVFVDDAPAWHVHHPTIGRGFVAHDFNGDGWLDLVRRDVAGPTLVSTSRCGDAAWLRVALAQPGMNSGAVGARITAHIGDRTVSRVVFSGGTNHASSGPPEVHLGLGTEEEVDDLVVAWPDGLVSHLGPVGTRRRLDIRRRALY